MGGTLELRVLLPLSGALLAANVVGALVVFALLFWVVPLPEVADDADLRLANGVLFAAGLVVAIPLGLAWSRRRTRALLGWLAEDRAPTPEEQRRTLQAPFRLLLVPVVLWSAGAALFAGLNSVERLHLAFAVGLTILLGACVTCALGYLVAERILRPITELALAERVPERAAVPGIAARILLAWALGAAVPLVGLVIVGVEEVAGVHASSPDRLGATMAALGALGLVIGAFGMWLAANSVADPVERVRHAVAEVEEGRTDVAVRVSDGGEIGLLQAGFNRMVAGLRERERLRDLFGRQVGEDVAAVALEHGAELGGEEREIAVLFVDLAGSTALAAERPPGEVVALLNAFFGLVVEEVRAHGGAVNKFEGDAALCVFGAPVERDDAAGDALAAARSLSARLRAALPEAGFGIGVSAGRAVAGHVGAAERFEYTVIGDPVNEAARLVDLAKREEGRVLASDAALARAGEAERARWALGKPVVLRGRTRETIPATVR
ncbi:MAG: adenylate/guanylate cyclase domain-containing protein [Solirubrobacteraceae bacterium]